MLDAVQHIGNNSGSGRQLAGALAVEHNLAGRIAVDHDGVEYVLNSGQRAFLVDEMRLTGVSRVLTQEVGFDNTFADVEYFTYDPTGAYAPLEPVFGGDVTGIEGTNSDAGVYGTVIDNWLTLNNVPESAKIEIYSSTGVLIAVENSYTSGQSIPLYEKGIYVCVVNDGTRKEIVKIVY